MADPDSDDVPEYERQRAQQMLRNQAALAQVRQLAQTMAEPLQQRKRQAQQTRAQQLKRLAAPAGAPARRSRRAAAASARERLAECADAGDASDSSFELSISDGEGSTDPAARGAVEQPQAVWQASQDRPYDPTEERSTHLTSSESSSTSDDGSAPVSEADSAGTQPPPGSRGAGVRPARAQQEPERGQQPCSTAACSQAGNAQRAPARRATHSAQAGGLPATDQRPACGVAAGEGTRQRSQAAGAGVRCKRPRKGGRGRVAPAEAPPSKDEVLAGFRLLDPNGRGFFGTSNIMQVATALGVSSVNSDTLPHMMSCVQRLTGCTSQRIDFSTFQALLAGLTPAAS